MKKVEEWQECPRCNRNTAKRNLAGKLSEIIPESWTCGCGLVLNEKLLKDWIIPHIDNPKENMTKSSKKQEGRIYKKIIKNIKKHFPNLIIPNTKYEIEKTGSKGIREKI